jgi:hypothetical protein
MQKIPFGIRMPNKPFCPFAQMDKVQFAATPQKTQNKSIFRGFATPNPPLCKAENRLA